jgi:hypothetical protein
LCVWSVSSPRLKLFDEFFPVKLFHCERLRIHCFALLNYIFTTVGTVLWGSFLWLVLFLDAFLWFSCISVIYNVLRSVILLLEQLNFLCSFSVLYISYKLII